MGPMRRKDLRDLSHPSLHTEKRPCEAKGTLHVEEGGLSQQQATLLVPWLWTSVVFFFYVALPVLELLCHPVDQTGL